ncbi:MAG TPA: hypothetical protein VNA69_04100 [Thermoanaerobaculia bacterium]|nr:hypothetical protein [Thermoanaerobaculia bacterium]
MLKRLAVVSLVALLLPLQAAALDKEDLLALVAMPLAVAAVSEMTDVPTSELIDVVTLLNDAAVPPAQFVEVVRYVPVALVVENDEPSFVEFVRVQQRQGVRGTQLVAVIEERFRTFGLPDVELDVVAPRVVVVNDDFIPLIVRTRVAEVKAHPHGGPPGQLKKQRGVQTGAEIVHGGRTSRPPDARVAKPRKENKGHGDHDDKGKGHGKGHGKGKGKG